jgi:hypothetical protein
LFALARIFRACNFSKDICSCLVHGFKYIVVLLQSEKAFIDRKLQFRKVTEQSLLMDAVADACNDGDDDYGGY